MARCVDSTSLHFLTTLVDEYCLKLLSKPISNLGAVFANLNLSSPTLIPPPPPPSPLSPRPFPLWNSQLIPPPPHIANISSSSTNLPLTPPPLKLYTQAIELDSTNATYYSNRAASYISLRKFRPALEDCQQFFVIAANARHSKQSQATEAKILLRLARCHLALGDPTASLSALKLLSAEFDNVTATHQVQELQAKATLLEAHLIDLNQAREEGEWILVKENLEACVKLVEDVGTEDEELPLEWWIWSIESDFELRNLDDAMEKSEKTLAIHPTSFLTLSLRARIHLYLGNYELSVKDFEAAIYVGRVGEASREQLDELESEVRIAIAAHEGVQNLKNDANEEDNKGAGEGGHHEQGEVERKNSYYAILGLQRTCEAVEIKKAYKRESLKHHPDKGGDGERFKMISEAYSVLSDTEQRQQYDAELELQEQELNEANREDAEEENASSEGFEGSEGLLALVLFNYTVRGFFL
ncbi:hypothetical protein C0991_004034 [Blastosporella zonata]|nr:hypothetical protein C0991_004034 [Blastosporella zonata]